MIGVQLKGRLGNQMFQYAFAISQAKKFKTAFFVTPVKYPNIFHKYFTLNHNEAFIPVEIPGALTPLCRICTNQHARESGYFDPDTVLAKSANGIIWDGYFQSVKYFENIKQEIPNIFCIKSIYKKRFQEIFNRHFFGKKILAIHVRRTDYSRFGDSSLGGKDLRLPASYYHNLLTKTAVMSDIDQIICMGDDQEWMTKEFSQYKNVFISTFDMIIDFQILMCANKLILSNSSFVWWAAFLNYQTSPEIFAPKNWLGFKTDKEIPSQILYLLPWQSIEVTTP